MGMFDSLTNFFSGGKQQGWQDFGNTIGAGMDDMRGNVQKANDILNPYNQGGLGQLTALQQAIARMMNPQQFNKEMMSGYSMSPQAQHQMAIGNDATTNAALASGMGGSTPHLNEINEQSQAISNRDQQQYLDNMYRTYNQGVGVSQNLYGQGLGAAGQMANGWTGLNSALANMYAAQAQAQQQQSESESDGLMGMITGGLNLAAGLSNPMAMASWVNPDNGKKMFYRA